MQQPLSKEAEARITAALNEVIDLVATGSSPTDAMVKVATERQLPAGHVNLMVNAFNIGRSEAQRKGSPDLFEKVSEFELADAQQVLDRMFPEVVKAAGVLAEETIVSPEYSTPPKFLFERARRQKLAAAAGIDWTLAPKPADLPRDPTTAVKRAHAKLVNHKRAFEEARRAAQFQFDRVNGLVEKLATVLLTPDSHPFGHVAANAKFRFGKVAEALFECLEKKHKVLAKQASLTTARPHVIQWGASPYKEVIEIVDAVEAFDRARENYEKLAEVQDREAGEIARPFVPAAPEHGSVLGQSSEKTGSFLGGLFGTAMGTTAARSAMGTPDAAQLKVKNKLTDPQHEATLRNIQTESLLNDLMANDEVISGYDPNEVVSHFNEISQLSPRSVNQSGLMRALLRKRLQQGALDPYEVDMLLKIENSLKTRDNPGGGGVLNGSAGVM